MASLMRYYVSGDAGAAAITVNTKEAEEDGPA